MHVWPFYGLATLGAIGLARYGQMERRSEDTFGAALVLGVLWIIWNCGHWFVPHPYNQFFPFLDAITCSLMAIVWRNSLRPWKACLIILFVTECLIHAGYFELGDDSRAAKYVYDLKQNLIYIGQLACVSSVGIGRLWRVRGRSGD